MTNTTINVTNVNNSDINTNDLFNKINETVGKYDHSKISTELVIQWLVMKSNDVSYAHIAKSTNSKKSTVSSKVGECRQIAKIFKHHGISFEIETVIEIARLTKYTDRWYNAICSEILKENKDPDTAFIMKKGRYFRKGCQMGKGATANDNRGGIVINATVHK